MQERRIDGQPQFFNDDYLVDNRWGVEYLTEAITRVFHAPVKHPANPLIAERGGYVNVLRADGRFRMWYQEYWDQSMEPRKYTYGVAYAESDDGIDWELAPVEPFEGAGRAPTVRGGRGGSGGRGGGSGEGRARGSAGWGGGSSKRPTWTARA